MNIEVKKIKHTPVRLVIFEGNIVGCFYYGDNYVNKDNFDERIWAYVKGEISNEADEREVCSDTDGGVYTVPSGDYGSGV